MKNLLASLICALGLGAMITEAGLAQVGFPTWNNQCDTYLNWSNNVYWNRGDLRQETRIPSFTWFCQARAAGRSDSSYGYNFYDLSSAIAYDHSQYRCEREMKNCEVRCALVPVSCITYTP